MSSPADEKSSSEAKGSPTLTHAPTVSDEHLDHLEQSEKPQRRGTVADRDHLQVPGQQADRPDIGNAHYLSFQASQDQATVLADNLAVLQAERLVSNADDPDQLRRSYSRVRTNTVDEPSDDVFNQAEKGPAAPGLPSEDANRLKQIYNFTRNLPRFFRYFLYSLPVTVILLIPIFLGIFLPRDRQSVIGGPGGVSELWFGIWLEVVWLSLWGARIVTSILPFVLGLCGKVVGSNYTKWKDIGKQLELSCALFLWMLAVLISFLPIVNSHKVAASVPDEAETAYPSIRWINVVDKVIIALFVLALLNFIEKVLIQWIAAAFHQRTYSTRIETNKQSIAYLVHLYVHSKDRLVSEAAVMGNSVGSGTKTPIGVFANNARDVANKIGDMTNRVAGDFTGRQVKLSNHPRKVVSELLRNSSSAQILARRLFRTYAERDSNVLIPQDLRPAFPTDEDAEAAFLVFDRDLNGDVSMEELEAFVDEVHREKKAITASLKDLDSVITKLDRVFLVVVVIITVIVFITSISASTASALASAGSAILGLSWLLQATAQEFLQSIIFVFVKHPFDVGDRVTVYNSGTTAAGDDYYVTEISLLYTEFKKMQGMIVQAPNSVLNNLFILNQRRSGALADVFTLTMKYGTPASVITELEARMSEFVEANKRDYTSKIITELCSFEDACSMQVNFICFHKSSYQNELLRLIRHNKFAHELMDQMVALGIEQPRKQYQISGRDFPIFQSNVSPPSYSEDQQQSVDPAILSATRRRRANSRAHTDSTDMYQDVFVSRANNNVSTSQLPPVINEEQPSDGEEPRRTSTNLSRPPTNGSGRSRGLFSRSGGTLRRQQRSSDRSDRPSVRDMV
ncbi:hypothetical protein GGR57DRAFT_483262 [Xylariaceae sp. FL1272]|nr:hypothetical protein GGR57DRAFT_483262 [Xylariaceae sp. FL1272]